MLLTKRPAKSYLLMNKKLNLLGLAQAAGKLVSGEPQVLTAIKQKQAKVVLLAADCGAATQKKIRNKCSYYDIQLIENYTQYDLSQALGKKRTVVCLTDKGFAQSFLSK